MRPRHGFTRLIVIAGLLGWSPCLNAQELKLLTTLQGGHKERILNVAFSPDGTLLASSSNDLLQVWDLAAGKCVSESRDYLIPTNVQFTADGKHLVYRYRGMTSSPFAIAEQRPIKRPKNAPRATGQFSADGQIVVLDIVKGSMRLQTLATPFDMSTGKLIESMEGDFPQPFEFGFNPQGTIFAGKDRTSLVRLWDVASGKQIFTLPKSAGRWFQFSPDGKLVVVECCIRDRKSSFSFLKDQSVQIFDVSTGKSVATLEGAPHHANVLFGFPPASDMVAMVYNYHVHAWNVKTGKSLATFKRTRETLGNHVDFSPDGKLLAASSGGGRLHFWSVATGEIVAELAGAFGYPSFSPDGTRLAVGGEKGAVRLYELRGESKGR